MTAVTIAPPQVRPYTLLGVLQVLDVATTWWILNHWSERAEGNPVAGWFFQTFGLTLGILVLALVKFGCVYGLYRKQSGVRLVTALYSLVIFNNLLFLGLWLIS